MAGARWSAWRKASEMPWPGVKSLKCPASPSRAHPGPAASRKKLCHSVIILIGPTRVDPATSVGELWPGPQAPVEAASRSAVNVAVSLSEIPTPTMYCPPSAGAAMNALSPTRPMRRWPAMSATPSKYATAIIRPPGMTWYSCAPTHSATFERMPSAPTTSRARIGPSPVSTPTTRSPSWISPVTRVLVRTSAPAASAALTSTSSRVTRRTHSGGRSSGPGPPSTRTSSLMSVNCSISVEPTSSRASPHTESFEEGRSVRLDDVGRERVAREPRLVDDADVHTGLRQHASPAESRRTWRRR